MQGMVETSFTGEHSIKGKSGAQKIYRLDAIRQGVTRFEAAVSGGLVRSLGANGIGTFGSRACRGSFRTPSD